MRVEARESRNGEVSKKEIRKSYRPKGSYSDIGVGQVRTSSYFHPSF